MISAANTQVAFLTRKTFMAVIIDNLGYPIRCGLKPERIVTTFNSRDEWRCDQFI